MSITYRKATKKDSRDLYSLAVQFSEFNAKKSGRRRKFFFNGWKEAFLKEIIGELNNPNSTYFIALDKDAQPNITIGYILAKKCKDLYYYCIEELFVLPKYRKLRVGKKLIRLAVKKGKSYGLPVRVEIFNWNDKAKKFYQSNGFKEDSIVFEYAG
jgi:ribosomal protein S18 acetylase RimI-like enzyme